MTDMEQRVRRELRDMADSLSLPPDPRHDFETRIAGRGKDRRRLLMVSAAAAVVAAAVAVPIVVHRGGSAPIGGPSPTVSSEPARPPNEQVVLASVTVQGVELPATLIVQDETWCLNVEYDPAHMSLCYSLGAWPQVDPNTGTGSWVMPRLVLGGTMPTADTRPDLVLFVTAPTVTTLEVKDAAGTPVPVRQAASATPTARYYLATFPTNYETYKYTARDAHGAVVEQGKRSE